MRFLRRARARLAKGLAIPGTTRVFQASISRASTDDGTAEAAVLARHAAHLVDRVPELRPFFAASVSTSKTATLAFLDFANAYVPLVREEAREPHVRTLLSKLQARIDDPAHRLALTLEIAKSDLRGGVPDRATILLSDSKNAAAVAQVEIDDADAAYGSEARLIENRTVWQSAGDVRGQSVISFLRARADNLRGLKILHVAPERSAQTWFEDNRASLGFEYRTFDAFDTGVDLRGDLGDTGLNLPTDFYDLVLCHRVLEHILDDRTALANLFRVLRPGGELSISVPQTMSKPTNEWLVQDGSHHDHVRQYGADFADRLEEAGFDVQVERDLLDRPLEQHILDGTYPMRIYSASKPEAARG